MLQRGIDAVSLTNCYIKPRLSVPVACFHTFPVTNCASIKWRDAVQVFEVFVGEIAVIYVIGYSNPGNIRIRDAVVVAVTGLNIATFKFGRTAALC